MFVEPGEEQMGLGLFSWGFLTYSCTLTKLPFLLQRKFCQFFLPFYFKGRGAH